MDLTGFGLYNLLVDSSRYGMVTELHIGNNRLVSVPDWLGDLKGLTELHCPFNFLNKLPTSMTMLQDLRVLDLSNNLFASVPPLLRVRSLVLNRLRFCGK